ncbi:MAG: zinc ribbon domain-containing protein [Lentisphaeria bacterium]|nr:zinc ribbon domain-containing protein [Lentisphaeria bacterium]
MFCKFCGAELEKDTTLCAKCGKDNEEKKPKTKLVITIVVAVLCGALLMAALGAMVYYGVYGRLFRENDAQYKDNYTVSDSVLQSELDTVVATIGDAQLTNEQLQVFYWMQIYNYGYYYDVDFTEPLHTQLIDTEKDLTYQQYFLDTAA